MKNLGLILGGLVLAACGTDGGSTDDGLIDGFNPGPTPDGYERHVTASYMLQPGEDVILCQWIQVPPTAALDIVDVMGAQTKAGHHAVLYSSSLNEAPGTSRECTTDDMVSVEFLGGIGGEGVGNVTQLPAGMVFRHREGRSLMANVHYLNATDDPMEVQSVLDVRTAAPSAERLPAGMSVIHWQDFQIPPGAASYSTSATCTWPTETSVVMWSNHMHEYGMHVVSEIIRVDGSREMLADDPQWTYESAFNPKWSKWELAAPKTIHAGDKVRIECTWKNTTDRMKRFPDEMCDGIGFYKESSDQVICHAEPTVE